MPHAKHLVLLLISTVSIPISSLFVLASEPQLSDLLHSIHTPAVVMPRSQTTSTSPPTAAATRSSSSATKRLLHEISEYREHPNPCLLHLGPTSDGDLLHWEAVLKGAPHSAYAHGLWLLALTVPPTYPLHPPRITFVTPICHPNVAFATGEICLTLLTAEHWSPLYTLSATLAAVHQLLLEPVVESPLNVDIANLYREGDRVGAEALVRFWTAERRWSGEGDGGWITEARR